jgi:putative SOS response-associated peptidase YedK
MCGRFGLFTYAKELVKEFSLVDYEPRPMPERRYNITPTSDILGIRAGGEGPRLATYRWGFAFKDGGRLVINARAETLHEKGAFKGALADGRVAVPADGFYEWVASPHGKQPFWIHRADGRPMAFAGLARTMRVGDTDDETDCAVIATVRANGLVGRIHDRMPAILDADGVRAWLGLKEPTADAVEDLLGPMADDVLAMHPVSPKINRADTDEASLVTPVASTLDGF